MLKLIGIKTNEGYLITDNIENKEYFNSLLGNLKINKEPVLPTFKKHWFKIKSKPEIIEKTIEPTKKYIGYKLKDISLSDRFKDNMSNEFYNQMQSFLYEHYVNAENDIQKNLISKISDEFIKNPKDYKFQKLRERLFDENKELLIDLLTEDSLRKYIENIIWDNIQDNHLFNWKWTEKIVKILSENSDKFENNKSLISEFLKQIEQLNAQISYLKSLVNELENR